MVALRWSRRDLGTTLTDDALVEHLRSQWGVGRWVVGRLCPRCGSSTHGRPWAAAGDFRPAVSLARAGPHVMIGAASSGLVGVDVESVSAVAAAWDGLEVLHPSESVSSDLTRARTWVRKEAVLKAYGVGLGRAMSSFRLKDFPGELCDVPAPDGQVAAVATLPDDAARFGHAERAGRPGSSRA